MTEKSQVDHLMDDLRTVDDFFRGHDYHRWGDDVDSRREILQKGFDVLSGAEFSPGNVPSVDSPNLVYRDILSYGESPNPPGDGKRFFVDVRLMEHTDHFGYAYHIGVRPFPPETPSSVEFIERSFVMPIGVYREDKPLQKMLDGLEKAL